MTTETPPQPTQSAARLVLSTAVATTLVGSIIVAVGFLDSAAAGKGALIGVAAAGATFLLGSLVVTAVSSLLPAAAMLVALLTYVLQVVALALLFVGLNRSGALGEELSREWIAGGVIGVTVAWSAVQLTLAVRSVSTTPDVLKPEPR